MYFKFSKDLIAPLKQREGKEDQEQTQTQDYSMSVRKNNSAKKHAKLFFKTGQGSRGVSMW